MKAKDLIEILEKHPDWDVAFQDHYYGGVDEYMSKDDIDEYSVCRYPKRLHPPKQIFMIRSPYQCEL